MELLCDKYTILKPITAANTYDLFRKFKIYTALRDIIPNASECISCDDTIFHRSFAEFASIGHVSIQIFYECKCPN